MNPKQDHLISKANIKQCEVRNRQQDNNRGIPYTTFNDGLCEKKIIRETMVVNYMLDQMDLTKNIRNIPFKSYQIHVLNNTWDILQGRLYIRSQNKSQ